MESVAGAGLAPGQVLVVAGRGLGRIESIEKQGDNTVITTSEANLADAIDDGTVGWNADIGWDADWIVGDQPGGPPLRKGDHGALAASRTTKLAGLTMVDEYGWQHDIVANVTAGGIDWSFSQGGNKYHFKIQPGGDSMNVIIQVARNHPTYTAKGTVGRARTTGHADYAGGKLAGAKIDANGMNTHLKLSIAAAGSGKHPNFSFPVPGLMFKCPLMAGPIPVTIGMTAQVVGALTVPASGSATFETDFNYSADAGYQYQGSNVVPTGQLGTFVMNPQAADPAGYIGEHVNVEFGVAFPKLSVTLFGAGPSAYIQPGVVFGTEITWGPVCKTAYVRGELQGGYDFALLGVSFASDSATLWKKRRDSKGDGCP